MNLRVCTLQCVILPVIAVYSSSLPVPLSLFIAFVCSVPKVLMLFVAAILSIDIVKGIATIIATKFKVENKFLMNG